MGEIGKIKEGVRIIKCTCQHEYQDLIYGKFMRVHNVSSTGGAACTVCTPNYRFNRMSPATMTPASPMLGHGIIPSKADRAIKMKRAA